MPRRLKEEDRIEIIIRGLMKHPDNRRCINCNSLGPQYVCTTFWTFVCTDCSGVHREFSHRVKSVSMGNFNDDEIAALQAGGNEKAKQIYFRTWDSYSSYPDSSNLQKLREFVNSVYVDRKYTGGRRLPKAKSDSRESFCDWPSRKSHWRRRDDYLGKSAAERSSNRSRDDDYYYDRSLFVKSSSAKGGKGLNLRDFLEERNPRNNQEMPRSSSLTNRPSHMQTVDDRFREDGSAKRYERNPFKESESVSGSSESLRTASSLPVMRPVNAILGDEAPKLRITAPTGADDDDDEKAAESSSGGQKADDATVMKPAGTNEPTNLASLIDFSDAEPEATPSAVEHQAGTNNESSTTQAAAIVPMNSVESLLFELSAPMTASAACTSPLLPAAAAPAHMVTASVACTSPMLAQMNFTYSTHVDTTEAPETSNSSEALAITVVATDQPLDREYTYPVMQDMQQTHQLPTNTSTGYNTLQTASSVESSLNEQGNKSPAAEDLRRTKSVPVVQSLQDVNPSPSTRKEIPLDIFTSGYPSFSQPVSVWQIQMHHGAGYNMQFHPPAMHLAACPPKPKNPFDIDDDRFQVQAPPYLYMPPVQGDISSMQASAASQFHPSPYALAHSQSHMSAYGMNMPQVAPGAYMAQQPYNTLITRPEENADSGISEDVFASLNPIHRRSGAHSSSSAPTSPLPRAGNPFE